MGFPRQEYWSGLPFPSSEDLPNPGIEPMSPAWQADSLPLNHLGNKILTGVSLFENPSCLIIPTYMIINWHSAKMDFPQRDTQIDILKRDFMYTYTPKFFQSRTTRTQSPLALAV